MQHYYGEVLGDGLATATMYAINHQFPYIFYVSNNTIYQFDMGHPEEQAKEVLSFPGETIKCIKFCPMARERGRPIVARMASGCGSG